MIRVRNLRVRSFGVIWIRISDPRNRRIHSGHGFIGSFDALWSEWSWITNPEPDHPKKLGNAILAITINAVNVTLSSGGLLRLSKDACQPPPFSMPSKLLILHGEAKSFYGFTISCVPDYYRMTRAAPRAISLENDKKKGPVSGPYSSKW